MLSFKLEHYFPTNYIQTLSTGANKPILTRAVNRFSGIKEDIVVKLMDSERMGPNAAMKEITASFIAMKLGLKTPTPYICEINDLFINSRSGTTDYVRIKNSKGLNFATKNIVGLEQFGPHDILDSKLYPEALKIFSFDLMIQNPDRTTVHGKPNLFTTGHDLWILDHELAFNFLIPLIGRTATNPWEFSPDDKNMIENHILFKKLKKKRLDFSLLDNFLDKINDTFWLNLIKIVPNKWLDDDFKKIKNHINSIKENQESFVNQIKVLLK